MGKGLDRLNKRFTEKLDNYNSSILAGFFFKDWDLYKRQVFLHYVSRSKYLSYLEESSVTAICWGREQFWEDRAGKELGKNYNGL